MRLGMIM